MLAIKLTLLPGLPILSLPVTAGGRLLMALMSWNKSYSVGVQTIDSQHNVLFDIINELHGAMMKGQAHSLTGSLLRKLLDYTNTHFSAEEAMIGTVNKKLIGPLLRTAGIERAGEPCGRVTEEQVRRLSVFLSCWRFPVTGTQGWLRAQVTSGGVDTAEIDPQRMESKIVPGLFLAGEIIDVDGDCGGYNLQWAWSSGRIAGLHAAAQ